MSQLPDLLIPKQTKYFQLCLSMLPAKFQAEDNNRLSLIYFCLQGLELINQLKFNAAEIEQFAQFIYDGFLVEDGSGFRASSSFASVGIYDKPNISATFFALASLLLLKSEGLTKLNRSSIMEFLRQCQLESGENRGGFCPTLSADNEPFGESDMRICFMAVCVRHILQCDTTPLEKDIDVKALQGYILARINYNGAFVSNIYTEGHLGLTYCGLATLRLLNYDFDNSAVDFSKTVNWIMHRQVNYPDVVYESVEYPYYRHEDYGSFNGRENKLGDNCYSWWGLASLQILGSLPHAKLEQNASFLLMNQNRTLGGFAKNSESAADPYHTFLSLASLSLIKKYRHLNFQGEAELQDIEPLLTITESASQFLKSLNWS